LHPCRFLKQIISKKYRIGIAAFHNTKTNNHEKILFNDFDRHADGCHRLCPEYSCYTQLYVWTNSGGLATGESIVATLTFPVSGLYSGAAIVGQIIDGNSNWGQVLPTVANFKVNVNFSVSSYAIVQDVITPDVTLELKSISATQVILVANCVNPTRVSASPFVFRLEMDQA
jgi:hypothetical protein